MIDSESARRRRYRRLARHPETEEKAVKKRLLKKKVRRLEDLDTDLSACFRLGGHRRYGLLIYTLRAEIRYIRRRWPKAYELAFGGGFDLGHMDADAGKDWT